jgi:hypothetical protein
VSYCCNENDMKNSISCLYSPLCSWNISSNVYSLTNTSMRYQTCPHEKLPCGIDNPEIKISMDETYEVDVGRLFDVGDICHYSFGAWDEIPESQLEKFNRRWLQLYIE